MWGTRVRAWLRRASLGSWHPTNQKRDVGHPKLIDLLESEPEWVEPEVGDVWVGDGWRKQGTGEFVREGERRDDEAAS
jgi:hypothetical protein